MYSRMHASTTYCNSCARMLLSPAQLLACARGRRRRSAAPALAYSSARPWRARHGCSISGQKRILHARMHAPPTHCSSCARMILSPTRLFACLHAHACAAAALQLLRSHAPQPAHGALFFIMSTPTTKIIRLIGYQTDQANITRTLLYTTRVGKDVP